MKLRCYQESIIEKIRLAFASGFRRPLVVAPTGAGKTMMFCYIASKASLLSNDVMILVHKDMLVRQTSRTLANFGVKHGIIQSGKTQDRTQQVQVASIQTLVNRLDQFNPKIIIVDEAHHAVSPSWSKVINHFSNAKVIGFTATPERLDGRGLGDIFDHLIDEVSVLQLIQDGFLSKPRYFIRPEINNKTIHIKRNEFDMEEMSSAMSSKTVLSNIVSLYADKCNYAPSIAFCCNLEHAHLTVDKFNSMGYNASVIEGKSTEKERQVMLNDLADRKLHVLASVELINEGVDVPIVEAALLLRGTASLQIHLQQIGRVLRTHDSKQHATILDCVGNCNCHGFAETHREWTLEGKKRKFKDTDKEPFANDMMRCPKCYAAHEPSDVCPECGHVYERKAAQQKLEIEGELQQADENTTCECGAIYNKWIIKCPSCDIFTDKKRQMKYEVGKARTREELADLAKKRGYKPHWVDYILNARKNRY